MAKRQFVVRKVKTSADLFGTVGPWVVEASTPRGAFRVIRKHWPHWLTNHVRRETHALECEGVVSNRIGKLLEA